MIRLILLIILFLASLLTVFGAPAYYLWILAILITEYPIVFIGIVILLIVSGFWIMPYRIAGTVVGVVTIALLLSPIVRAYFVSSGIKDNMREVFNPSQKTMFPKQEPFTFIKLLSRAPRGNSVEYTYVSYADTSLTLDFYASHTPGKRPCVIVVHGGSWSSGDSKQLPELNAVLANKGYNVASINYRLAPKYQTPAPIEDVKNCLMYLRRHADKLNIDTTQFVLLGRSAGAQIALLAAYTLHDSTIKGVIDFYGPADMVWGYSVPSNPLIMDSRKVMSNYIGGRYPQVPDKYIASSPIKFVNKQSPPTLIIHGSTDVLVSPQHSRRLDNKLKKFDVPHYVLKLPWATHGFDFNLNGPGGQLSTFAVETFLNTITR